MSPQNSSSVVSEEISQQTGPVGSGEYTVQAGECLSSIAYEHGLTWQKIWNDPGNAEVKNTRKDPNILYPGDRLHIPEIEQREESCVTEKVHRFVRKGVPEQLNIIIKREGEPIKNEKYTLNID